MFRLDGKTALVTGASQGIGKTLSLRLAQQGAQVILAARSADKLAAVAEEIEAAGGRAFALSLDVSKPDSIAEQLAEIPEEFADIDILVNNAGITRDGLFARMGLEQWQQVIDTNLTGAYGVTKEIVKGMMRRRYGRIIFVSSVIGLMGNAGQANYAASKAGVIGMAKSLAKELGGRKITVNVVAPGFVETAMTSDLSDKVRDQLEKTIVVRRLGEPDDVAAPVVFLASDEAAYITGEVVNVSGGMYI